MNFNCMPIILDLLEVSSHGNKVTLERIFKRAWRVISYRNLDICKSLHNFESLFSYYIWVKFYKIMRINCHPYLLRKIKMQDTRHAHKTRFSVYNYNVPFYSESVTNHFCISLLMYGIAYLCILEILILLNY